MDIEIPIEPAGRDDIATIARMSRDLIEHGLGWRWRAAPLLRLLEDPESSVIVARDKRRVCAFAAMSFDWKRASSHLVLLAVAPATRRRGVGRALVRWLEVVARRGGIDRVGLEVRATSAVARRFYGHLGYAETGRVAGYYQGREDAIKMASTLRTSASAS